MLVKVRRLFGLAFVALLFPAICSADIFTPGSTVSGVRGEVFTWSSGVANSTSAFWDSFHLFPGGTAPGGIAPGTDVAAEVSFADGGIDSDLTFDSFATIVGSGNAYGFNFAPGLPAFQPEFVTDATLNVRSGIAGGSNTRIVAQWRTQGSELDYERLLLRTTPTAEGIAPSLSLETGRSSLGGFGGELVDHMAIWDLTSSQAEFNIDFNADANHMSLDQVRIDSFTQATPFAAVTAVPEPGSLALLSLATGLAANRYRRRKSSLARA